MRIIKYPQSHLVISKDGKKIIIDPGYLTFVSMPQNSDFLVDGVFFHPGDGVELEGFSSPNTAIAISGPPDATVNFFDAGIKLAQNLNAKLIIPIHYDAYPADPDEFKQKAAPLGIDVRPLSPGEETEV